MAKNWSVAEALQVITTGENLEAIRDIGRRFPLLMFFVLQNPLKIIEAFGPRITARTVSKQLEACLKSSVDEEVNIEEGIEVEPELEGGKKKIEEEEKVKVDRKVEAIKHVVAVENVAKKVDKEVMKPKKEKEKIKVEKVGEDDADGLNFDVEDLLED